MKNIDRAGSSIPFKPGIVPAFLLLVLCTGAPHVHGETDNSSPQQVVQNFRRERSFEGVLVRRQRDQIQADVEKLTNDLSQLKLPEQSGTEAHIKSSLAQDRAALTKADERIRLIERYLSTDCLVLAMHLEGAVSHCTAQGTCDFASNAQPLLLNESIKTGPGGSVLLLVEDGNQLTLDPDTTLSLKKQIATETWYELLTGKVHIQQRPEAVKGVVGLSNYQTSTAQMAMHPGDSDFDILLDSHNLTHIVVRRGDMTVTGLPAEDQMPTAYPWWKRGLSSENPHGLTGSDWFRVTSLEGTVAIWGADGSTRRAHIGDEVEPSERVATANNGWVWGEMPGDFIGVLKPGSVLAYRRSRTGPGIPMAQEGQLYFVLARQSSKTVDLTPLMTAHETCELPTDDQFRRRNLAFEVMAYPQGPSDWIPLDGQFILNSRPPAR